MAFSAQQRAEIQSAQDTIAGLLAGESIDVVWGAGPPRTERALDPGSRTKIFLPALPLEITEDEMDLVRAFTYHEAGHARHTEFHATHGFTGEEHSVANALEDGRVNRVMSDTYFGARQAFERLFIKHAVEPPVRLAEMEPNQRAYVHATLAVSYLAYGFDREASLELAGAESEEDAKHATKFLDSISDLIPRFPRLKSTKDSARYAKEIMLSWKPLLSAPPPPPPPEDSDEGDAEGNGGGAGDKKETKPKPKGQQPKPKPQKLDERVVGQVIADAAFGSKTGQRILGMASVSGYDANGRRHRPAGGAPRLIYVPSTENDFAFEVPRETMEDGNKRFQDLYGPASAVVATVRARLYRSMLGAGPVWIRNQERGSLDTRRLASLAAGSDRVFQRRVRQEKVNTAITMMVDCSASMAPPQCPLEENKMIVAIQLAMVFAEAAEALDVPVEVCGFTTYNHDGIDNVIEGRTFKRRVPLCHAVIKPFSRPFRQCHQAFVNVMRNSVLKRRGKKDVIFVRSHNIDGESLLWAANRIGKRDEARHVIITLSDGIPFASLAGRRDVTQAVVQAMHEHLKWVTTRLVRAGVELFGVGIKTDAVKKFYPRYLVVDTIGCLVDKGFETLIHFLKGSRATGPI